MFQIIPAVGTLIALAAFFFAVYYRTVQKYAQVGIDSVKSIGNLPSKSRLDATKILVNVFDLDVASMSSDQQFQLALKTFEKREKESNRMFMLLIGGGVILLLFVLIYSIARFDGGNMIQAALKIDEASASKELNERGYFRSDDTKLVERLASVAGVDRTIEDPFERVKRFSQNLEKQPTIIELRKRAEADHAPFEKTGEILVVSVPKRADQPRRYRAYVRRNSSLSGRMITLRTKGRKEYIRLHALGAIDVDSPADVQLNYEQYIELMGHRPNELKSALVTPSAASVTFDPTCPKYENFPVTDCDLPTKRSADEIGY